MHLPLLNKGDFTYVGASLVVWAVAESAVTIMAASVPMLRVLVRDVVPMATNRTRRTGVSGSGSANATRMTRRSGIGGLTTVTIKGGDAAQHYASGKSGIRGSSCGTSTVVVAGDGDDGLEIHELEAGACRRGTLGTGTAKRQTLDKTTSAPDGRGKGEGGGDHEESPAASVSEDCRWANSETSILGPEADHDNHQHGQQRVVVTPAAGDTRNKAAVGHSGDILATHEVDVAYANADRLEAQRGDDDSKESHRESNEAWPGEPAVNGEKKKKSRVLGMFRF